MQIKQQFSLQLVLAMHNCCMDTPIFDRSIASLLIALISFKSLQTYQMGLEKDEKRRICYKNRSFKPLCKLRYEG